MLEVFLSMVDNLGFLFGVFCFLCIMASAVAIIGYFSTFDENMDKCIHLREPLLKLSKILPFIAIVFALLAAFPTPDDLFKVRIGLIKYQLASPENVNTIINKGDKAIDEFGESLSRILKKVEDKYLPEQNKNKGDK